MEFIGIFLIFATKKRIKTGFKRLLAQNIVVNGHIFDQ